MIRDALEAAKNAILNTLSYYANPENWERQPDGRFLWKRPGDPTERARQTAGSFLMALTDPKEPSCESTTSSTK